MGKLVVNDAELTYERIAKNRSQTMYEVTLVVASRTGEVSIRRFELDVDSRQGVTRESVEQALSEWMDDNDGVTIERWIVQESNRCAYGQRAEESVTGHSEVAATQATQTEAQYRASLDFDQVAVEQGETVEFHAGGQPGVYGTERGTVQNVKAGTEGTHILIVETDSGTKRVREEWLVTDGDDTADEPDDDADS